MPSGSIFFRLRASWRPRVCATSVRSRTVDGFNGPRWVASFQLWHQVIEPLQIVWIKKWSVSTSMKRCVPSILNTKGLWKCRRTLSGSGPCSASLCFILLFAACRCPLPWSNTLSLAHGFNAWMCVYIYISTSVSVPRQDASGLIWFHLLLQKMSNACILGLIRVKAVALKHSPHASNI